MVRGPTASPQSAQRWRPRRPRGAHPLRTPPRRSERQSSSRSLTRKTQPSCRGRPRSNCPKALQKAVKALLEEHKDLWGGQLGTLAITAYRLEVNEGARRVRLEPGARGVLRGNQGCWDTRVLAEYWIYPELSGHMRSDIGGNMLILIFLCINGCLLTSFLSCSVHESCIKFPVKLLAFLQ